MRGARVNVMSCRRQNDLSLFVGEGHCCSGSGKGVDPGSECDLARWMLSGPVSETKLWPEHPLFAPHINKLVGFDKTRIIVCDTNP